MAAFIRSDTSRKAKIIYVTGSSGSGKSSFIKQEIKTAPRLIVFDPDDEYGDIAGIKAVTSGKQLAELIQQHKTSPLKVRLVLGGQKAFELCSALAFAWTNCVYVAEEIADVTRVGKAPIMWGQVLRRGRKRAVEIYAVTQRPSEADKTALTQATIVRTGLLGREADRKALAGDMDIPTELIKRLTPLDFIECHRNSKQSVFLGNAKERTRHDITEKVRSGNALT